MKYTKEDREALIDLIMWYRDEYHHSDSVHNEMIRVIKSTNDDREIEAIEVTVDGWLDY